MSLICEESGWDSECISDNGESVGLMQVQEKWHAELMDKTGCTDLTDPIQNVRVGTALLKRHFRTYQDPAWALMAYNGGQAYADRMIEQNKTSTYAGRILRRAAAYERSNSI
jgi:Soluble lytic murein transglycosylase and related regulatory proteins (some contain LysM/invasin domains)